MKTHLYQITSSDDFDLLGCAINSERIERLIGLSISQEGFNRWYSETCKSSRFSSPSEAAEILLHEAIQDPLAVRNEWLQRGLAIEASPGIQQ